MASFLLILGLHELQLFQPLEQKSWDLRLRLFAQPAQADKDIVVFLIDQYSLDVYEKQQGLSWPWPREFYSYLVDYLKTGRAKAVCFDLIFSESSRYGVHDDLVFSSTMKKAGNIFLPVFMSQSQNGSEKPNPEILEPYSWNVPEEGLEKTIQMSSVTLPEKVLLDSSKGIGNVRFSPDGDGVFRRIPLLFSYKKRVLSALPLEIARFVKTEKIQVKGGRSIWAESQKIPLDNSGQMVIKYFGPQGTYASYSVASIINSWAQIKAGVDPQVPPKEFKGKVVFIGTSAPGIYDLRSTPLSSVYPGVEIQATVLDNILNRNFISFPAKPVALIFIFVLALFTSIGVSLLERTWLISFFFIFCLSLPVGASIMGYFSGYWLEFVAPEFVVLTAFISASLLNYSLEGRKRRFIKNVFRFYLSPSLIELIVKDPELLKLGGDKKEITSFFTDLRGFTSISESLLPEELVDLLNSYLSEMSRIILDFHGTLDKYEGDAIIAFWNAPLDQEDHAHKACLAALDCQNRLKNMRVQFKSKYRHELFMRIGINTGPAVVGNMGSQRRFDYTAIGDTVNLASRLEGACKQYKVSTLIGEETHRQVKDRVLTREVDVIRVVGKRRPIRVFEILAEKEKADDNQLKLVSDFRTALTAYKKREWKKARDLFEKMDQDGLSGLYAERCVEFEKSPPPPDWEGVFDLKKK